MKASEVRTFKKPLEKVCYSVFLGSHYGEVVQEWNEYFLHIYVRSRLPVCVDINHKDQPY